VIDKNAFLETLEKFIDKTAPSVTVVYESPVPLEIHEYMDKLYGLHWFEVLRFETASGKQTTIIKTYAVFSNGAEGGGSRQFGLLASYLDTAGAIIYQAAIHGYCDDPLFHSSGAEEDYKTDERWLDGVVEVAGVSLFWTNDLSFKKEDVKIGPIIPIVDEDF
jgi:hypothetical protein